MPTGTPVLATTATANARVVIDVADQLGDGTLVLRGSLDRASLHLAVLVLPSAAHRLAWLADHLGRSNSAQRLRVVYGSLSAAGLAFAAGPVLLVDDRTDTAWTLTEATRVLREAGSGPVLPLVLAIDG